MSAKAHINLLTAELAGGGGIQVPFKSLAWVALVAVPFVLVAAGYGREVVSALRLRSRLAEVTAKRDAVNLELVTLSGRIDTVQKGEAQRVSDVQKRTSAMREILNDRIAWSDVLREVSFLVPDGVFLTNLESSEVAGGILSTAEKQVRCVGFARSHAGVTRLLSALEMSPWFSQVALGYSQQGAADQVNFEITARLRNRKVS